MTMISQLVIDTICRRYIIDNAMRLAPHYDADGDDYITFDEYRKRAIGEDIEGI